MNIGRRAVLALAVTPALAADPIRILSAGAVEPGLRAALELWRQQGGTDFTLTFATAPEIARRLAAGERPDLLIAPLTLMDRLATEGRLTGTPTPLGAVGIGIARREGAPPLAIPDEPALRAALLAAPTVVFNRASTGLYLERLFERMGIAAEINAKAVRFPDGAAVMERIAAGTGAEIGFGAITEILLARTRGVTLAGPLPDAVQNRTTYAAGLPTGAAREAERALAFLRSPEAKRALTEAGIT